MKKFLISCIVSILALTTPAPSFAMEGMGNTYVAAFTSVEFEDQWSGSCEPDFKFVYHSWGDFPKFIEKAKEKAGNRPLVIDIDVHGDEDGFYVYSPCIVTYESDDFPDETFIYGYYEKASMGYIYQVLESKLRHRKNTTVLIEACFAGNAYHTIRGNKEESSYIKNYPYYPDIPIYCVGSGFANPDISMMLQTKYHINNYYKDIRDYEEEYPLPRETDIPGFPAHLTCSTLDLLFLDAFLRDEYNHDCDGNWVIEGPFIN